MSAWEDWSSAQTSANFRVIFPEFAKASDALISSRIAMAGARTPADVWNILEAQGIAWLTAALLVNDPAAKDMRKGEKAGDSSYARERRFLETVVSSGFRTAGAP